MRFVDKATPQQLQQMVAARDPYSYMALSKLQEIRDNKLKADAKQPEAPPLAQTIPQQLAQLDQPQGIAALPQAMPQAMPQAPQDMPQEMQQASGIGPDMAPAGAGGGLVSFKHGGIAHFQTAGEVVGRNPGEAYSDAGALFNRAGNYFTDYFTQQRQEYEKGKQERAAKLVRDQALRETVRENTRNPFKDYTPEQRTAQDKAKAEAQALLGTPAPPVTPTPVPKDAAAAPTIADPSSPQFTAIPDFYKVSPPKLPADPQSIGIRQNIVSTPQSKLDAAFQAKTNFLTEIEGKKPKGYVKEDFEALRKDQDANTMAAFKKLQETLPSESAAIRAQIKEMQKANESESAQAPAIAMLKMATSMMATKSPFFLQALGEAGGAGLEDYQKIMALQKQQKLKLLESDANMAAAQDARNQNLLGIADAKTERSIKDKQDAYRLQIDADAQTYALQFKIGAERANMPIEQIELGSKLRVAEAQIAHLKRLPVPDQIQIYQYAQKNPEFRNYIQTQQNAARMEQYSQGIGRDYEVLRKSAALDPSIPLPDYDTFYDQRLNAFMRGINKVSGTPGPIVGSLQIPQSSAQRTQSRFLPQ